MMISRPILALAAACILALGTLDAITQPLPIEMQRFGEGPNGERLLWERVGSHEGFYDDRDDRLDRMEAWIVTDLDTHETVPELSGFYLRKSEDGWSTDDGPTVPGVPLDFDWRDERSGDKAGTGPDGQRELYVVVEDPSGVVVDGLEFLLTYEGEGNVPVFQISIVGPGHPYYPYSCAAPDIRVVVSPAAAVPYVTAISIRVRDIPPGWISGDPSTDREIISERPTSVGGSTGTTFSFAGSIARYTGGGWCEAGSFEMKATSGGTESAWMAFSSGG